MLKKFSTIALALLISLQGCSSQQPAAPEEVPVFQDETLKAGYIRSGEERELNADHFRGNLRHTEFRWFTDKGEILEQEGMQVIFKAPDEPGIIRLSCERIFRNRLQETIHFEFVVYRQIVLLKADDLVYAAHTIFPTNWNHYFDLLDSLRVKGSAGIIGKSLEDAPQSYYDKIKKLHKKGDIEFWNHGYSHELNIRNAQGEACHEFKNSGYTFQEAHLLRSQELAKEKLGFPFRAFGAPGNAFDEHTALLIEQNDDIRIWFYGLPAVEKSVINRSARSEIEFPTHKPDYEKFLSHYDADEVFLPLQIHPTSWNKNHFRDFRRILLYLKEKEVTFMKPTEFAKAFYPHLVEGLAESETIL